MAELEAEAPIRFELNNSKPVDLLDLTAALHAFGEAYQDHVISAGYDSERGNIRLFIKELRTGSIIAELASLAEQASFVLKHIDVAAGFVTHVNDILQYFLGKMSPVKEPPTRREAEQAMAIVEPVAKDGGSQLIVQIGKVEGSLVLRIDSPQANAIQNAAPRYIGPTTPTSLVLQDQLLALYQVRGDPSQKVGDRGIIETISPHPVKLLFASEGGKKQIVEMHDNPLQKIFVVDVEVRSADGKPKLYRILAVKDVLVRD